MSILRHWLGVFYPLILFGYGQVFFIIGLAIFFQSRRYARMELSGGFQWLAAFGFAHAFHEWGNLLIPMLEPDLSPAAITAVKAFQLVLLAVSFLCLLRFAIELVSPRPRLWPGLKHLPAIVFALWLAGPFGLGFILASDVQAWRSTADVLSRYAIGFPGAFCTAFALRRYAQTHLAPLKLPRQYKTLRISGISIGIYALVAGLVGPPAPFFPASVLNAQNFRELLVAPAELVRALAALVFAVSIIRALEVFEIEADRLARSRRHARTLAAERERTSRDIHDDVIQRLYAAGLMVQSLQGQKELKGSVSQKLERLTNIINGTIVELRTFLFGLATHLKSDSGSALIQIIDELRHSSGLEVSWKVEQMPALPDVCIHHLSAFLRESLTNVIRHADARVAAVECCCRDGWFYVSVCDDGRGLPKEMRRGYGVRDMRDRAHLLGGDVTFESEQGGGTKVIMAIPLERNR